MQVETVWNIGGRSLFDWLLVERPDLLNRLYLTRVESVQENLIDSCDVFLDNKIAWSQMREIDYDTMNDKENYCRQQTHEHYKFSFHAYERIGK